MFVVGINLVNFSSKARFWRINVNITFCEGKNSNSFHLTRVRSSATLVTGTSVQRLQYWLTHCSTLRKLVETWMIRPLLSGIPNQTVTHMMWRGCVIFELLKAANVFGNVLFITNIQICFWQKIYHRFSKISWKKVYFEVKKVLCCGGKLFLNSSLKHLWEKITSAKHISFALWLTRNEQKSKLSIGKIKPQVSFSLGSFVSDKNALLLSSTYLGGSWLKAPKPANLQKNQKQFYQKKDRMG